jgi:hypothetical protein
VRIAHFIHLRQNLGGIVRHAMRLAHRITMSTC